MPCMLSGMLACHTRMSHGILLRGAMHAASNHRRSQVHSLTATVEQGGMDARVPYRNGCICTLTTLQQPDHRLSPNASVSHQ